MSEITKPTLIRDHPAAVEPPPDPPEDDEPDDWSDDEEAAARAVHAADWALNWLRWSQLPLEVRREYAAKAAKRAAALVLVAVIGTGLVACGSDPLTRGVTGGAIGAGAGAGVAALT